MLLPRLLLKIYAVESIRSSVFSSGRAALYWGPACFLALLPGLPKGFLQLVPLLLPACVLGLRALFRSAILV